MLRAGTEAAAIVPEKNETFTIMVSAFDSCTDKCGWVAAAVAVVSYGSFGVPIKATKDIDVHPLIFQSYKTIVMFLTCWLVVLLGVKVEFTKWGILSGLLWVLGGAGGIYGIRMAGLAIAVGTWASIMIIVNFIFGILIFKEPVHDVMGTLGAFIILIIGLIGMSHFSAPKKRDHYEQPQLSYADQIDAPLAAVENSSYQAVRLHVRKTVTREDSGDEEKEVALLTDVLVEEAKEYHLVLFWGRLPLTKRQCGIGGAVINGIFTGMSLIPLHYAKEEGFGGANYMISFASGAFVSNFMLLSLFFFYNLATMKSASFKDALLNMPPWHVRDLWLPGCLAGILLSMAMFSSIMAVTYLGQGVGNSLVQAKILVSGLWGIFWYKEITGASTIINWFISAVLAVFAIICLSLERLEAGHH